MWEMTAWILFIFVAGPVLLSFYLCCADTFDTDYLVYFVSSKIVYIDTIVRFH
jgi:hypothetical protein